MTVNEFKIVSMFSKVFRASEELILIICKKKKKFPVSTTLLFNRNTIKIENKKKPLFPCVFRGLSFDNFDCQKDSQMFTQAD